jgi:membrane glycosyltransferase
MLKLVARRQEAALGLPMPDQLLHRSFSDKNVPVLVSRPSPFVARLVLFCFPALFAIVVASLLVLAFGHDGQILVREAILIALMALLCSWEALPTANALIGFGVPRTPLRQTARHPLSVAILATTRDDKAQDVLGGKIALLRSLQEKPHHRFSLHVLSDSTSVLRVSDERRLVRAALPLPVYYYNRPVNTDFKSGNIRNWIESTGAAYDAFIILDADSELDEATALLLADELASDPACGLIQTVPTVRRGHTIWQNMQSVASRLYGGLQGQGLSVWMGDESNYYGHNAIIRTTAFAASSGLPHLKGRGLWNGTILSHDFVEAALLRRAGWSVRLLPTETGSTEQSPTDVIAHLRRDARWCLGNFQHSRILGAAGLHTISRFHLLSGVFTYVSSMVWLATLLLWGALDMTQTGVGGMLAMAAFVLIVTNLLLPRVLGVFHAAERRPGCGWMIARDVAVETLYSSLIAPALMVQRVMIIGRVLFNRRVIWAPHDTANRSLPDYFIFHIVEVLAGLGLIASVEHRLLTYWFLPLAICLALSPVLSWMSARPTPSNTHENLISKTQL